MSLVTRVPAFLPGLFLCSVRAPVSPSRPLLSRYRSARSTVKSAQRHRSHAVHGEEPPFDRRARGGRLLSRQGAVAIGQDYRRQCMHQNHACASRSGGESVSRLFLCARCRCQVVICSRCDRGQIYCGPGCAQEARRCNQRKARARYQASVRGRKMHAQRSGRYRARHRRVTDQGSVRSGTLSQRPAPAVVAAAAVLPAFAISPLRRTSCHCCGNPVSVFLRQSHIRRPLRYSEQFKGPAAAPVSVSLS